MSSSGFGFFNVFHPTDLSNASEVAFAHALKLALVAKSKFDVFRVDRDGSVPQAILDASVEFQSDLIVMATDGPDGFLDGLRGSNTQRVLRMATCPVAVVPERRQLRL